MAGIGPVDPLIFRPSKRLNIITGDNGIGKTFILDLSWWALTQSWANLPPQPKNIQKNNPPILKFSVSGSSIDKPVKTQFSETDFSWHKPKDIPSIPGLVVYARVDGSFAVWDPVNIVLSKSLNEKSSEVLFSRKEVWNGKEGQIEGLLRDWVKWQERMDKYPEFETFKNVLMKLAPSDLGPIEIGTPQRIIGNNKEIPTLIHPYGEVPIVHESAGFKRIATIAYLIVWAWQEHKIHAKLANRKEEKQMVILVDETEAHLHPKWQRKILPAFLGIAKDLHAELSIQFIIATHSPLVLASSEPIFDQEQDKLFHLDLNKNGVVSFEELPFELRGTIDSWLSSPVFGLKFPGSDDRSIIIDRAINLQQSETITKKDVEKVTEKLREVLSAEDPFWVRWLLFAEEYGVFV